MKMASSIQWLQRRSSEPIFIPYPLNTTDIVDRSLRHRFRYTFKAEDFLNWKARKTLPIEFGYARKLRGKDATSMVWSKAAIPALYIQLVDQLVAEVTHSETDEGHESARRGSYAESILEVFGKEIRTMKGSGADFRSKVLNPIL
jgi:hypothetical protein